LAQHAHDAARAQGLPEGAIQMLYHLPNDLGLRMAGDARLGALGFTGSRAGGLALKAAADAAGVPAYLELSSINPVLMLPGALTERAAALAKEFFASCTMGSGQFCTSPGLLLTFAGAPTQAFVDAAVAQFQPASAGVLLNAGVLAQLQQALAQWRAAGADCLAGGERIDAPGFRHQATLMRVSGAQFLRARAALQTEAFGPASLIVVAQDDAELAAIIEQLEGNLTATVYCAQDGSDETRYARHAPALRARCGRLLENKMPTGVAVSPAMQHGGPYPASGHPGFSSVGLPAAVRRFAAWQCYDNVPAAHLPNWLRDANPARIWRCVDGQWTQDERGARPT
jgi:NADP-dependent aldehyde dehydrogenase